MSKVVCVASLLVLGLGAGCTNAGPDEGLSEDALRGGRNAGQTYAVRQDLRRCIYPLCGGFWVHAVNEAETRCADGTYAPECYVVEVDLSGLGLPASQEETLYAGGMLIDGSLGKQRFGTYGHLGVLRADDAWEPANDAAAASGTYYTVADSGIRCITHPCFSMEATELNTGTASTFSGLDLSAVAEDPTSLYEAFAAGALRVAGTAGDDGFGGTSLLATQAWTHVEPVECVADAECAMSEYHTYVQNPSDCYCPFCPVPMSAADAERNRDSWQHHCAREICPLARCAYPGEPVCTAAGSCGSVLPE